MQPAIEINGLVVTFPGRGGGIRAVDGLCLTVGQGEVFGFLGPNGAGKTTTMHVLLGFVRAAAGTARIFGQDVRHTIARQRIGYLPEHPETYRLLTGRELLTMAGRLFLLSRREARRRAALCLERVGLTDAADRLIGTYSRGMMQRVGLAQALINDPDLLILDEPAGGLDPIGRHAIRRLIADLRAAGKTVFFSSHELSEVELVCNRLAIMARGRIVAEGAKDDLIPRGESLERFFMSVIGRAEGAAGAAG